MGRSERSYQGPRAEYGRGSGVTSVVLGFLFWSGLFVGLDKWLDTSMIGVRQSERATDSKRGDFNVDVNPAYERAIARDKFIRTFVDPPETTINAGDGIVGALLGKKVKVTPHGGSDCLKDTPYDPIQNPDVRVTQVENNLLVIPPRSDLRPLRLDLSNGLYGYLSAADEPTQEYLNSSNCPPSF